MRDSLGWSPPIPARRWEDVFSSSRDLTRSDQAKAANSSPFLVSWTRHIAESLFATLFPADCRLCGEPLTSISRLPVCQPCLSAMLPISTGMCTLCGEGLVSAYAASAADGAPLCGLCQRKPPRFRKAAAYGSYDGGLRDLIHLLKYQQVLPAARVLGQMLAQAIGALQPSFGDAALLVVPVPLYRGKLRQRGFNQSEAIARAALKLAPRDRNQFVLAPRVLERQRQTLSQIGLTRHQRRANLRGAFVVPKPDAIKGRDILLVDDVYTTGTTVSECTRVLLQAGARRVWVATVARTLKLNAEGMPLEHKESIETEATTPAAA